MVTLFFQILTYAFVFTALIFMVLAAKTAWSLWGPKRKPPNQIAGSGSSPADEE